MLAQTLLALGLTLVAACLVNWAYLTEHAAASALPPLSVRAPLRSLRLLFASRRWVGGFGSETAGFALYVIAVALAPLALVQACIATLGTNAIPIAAAMTLFAEPLPDGPLGVVRVAAFAAVVAGAVALAPRRTDEVRQSSRPRWGLDPIAQTQAASKSGGRHESKLERTQATA